MSTLTFITPLPGLGDATDYLLEPIDGVAGLFALAAAGARPSTRIFLVDPSVYVPGYTPSLSHEQCASLQLPAQENARVYVVANPSGGETTVNLLAPIVVNPEKGLAAQLILEDTSLSVRASLVAH